MTTKRSYQYFDAVDVKIEETKRVNIYGVVKYFSGIKQIKKTGQFNALYTIIDPSVGDSYENGLRCNFFVHEKSQLPHVQVGDVLRFHRLTVRSWNGKPQLGNTKGHAWLLFSGGNLEQRTSSHEHPTVSDEDEERVNLLKRWYESIKSHLPETKSATNVKLCDIKPDNDYFNCVGRVVNVFNLSPECRLITICDGTFVRYSSFRHKGCLGKDIPNREYCYDISVFDDHVTEADKLNPGDFIKIVNVHSKIPTIKDLETGILECDLKMIGGTEGWVELVVHKGRHYGRGIFLLSHDDQLAQEVIPRLLSMMETCEEVERMRNNKKTNEEVEHNITKVFEENIEVMKKENQEIRQNLQDIIQKTKKKAIVSKENDFKEVRSMQESLTITDFPFQSFKPLNELIKCTIVPQKFHLRVKVLAVRPISFRQGIVGICGECIDLISITDEIFKNFESHSNKTQCPICEKGIIRLAYMFEMLVTDPTGVVVVKLFDKNAVRFFNGIQPIDVLQNKDLLETYHEKLRMISKNNTSDHSQLPWVEMCVCSYKTDSIVYHVFGTSLI